MGMWEVSSTPANSLVGHSLNHNLIYIYIMDRGFRETRDKFENN